MQAYCVWVLSHQLGASVEAYCVVWVLSHQLGASSGCLVENAPGRVTESHWRADAQVLPASIRIQDPGQRVSKVTSLLSEQTGRADPQKASKEQ